MIWKFYRTDPQVCHYLLGTMHVATQEAYTFVDIAKKYILEADTYAGEMDLNIAHGQNMNPYFILPEGEHFQHFFRPRQYAKYRKVIEKAFHIDIMQYDHYTPFFINNLLADLSLTKSYNLALDHDLWQFAKENGKEMTGVESFEDQVSILGQIPVEYQVKSFKSIVKNVAAFKHKLQNMNLMYANNRAHQLYKSSKKSMGKIRKLMIYDRNIHMVERVLEMSSAKTSFFAIGAAHFPGGKGILALLKKEGYKIVKLSS